MSDTLTYGGRIPRYVLPPMPDDLPCIIDYRMASGLVKHALPREPVRYVGGNGNTNACIVCPRIPYGCTGWRVGPDDPWRPMDELPAAWMPLLMRRRGTPHDPRRHVGE